MSATSARILSSLARKVSAEGEMEVARGGMKSPVQAPVIRGADSLLSDGPASGRKRKRRPRAHSIAGSIVRHHLAPDQPPADLARSRADLVELCVAQQAASGKVVDVAVSTQK